MGESGFKGGFDRVKRLFKREQSSPKEEEDGDEATIFATLVKSNEALKTSKVRYDIQQSHIDNFATTVGRYKVDYPERKEHMKKLFADMRGNATESFRIMKEIQAYELFEHIVKFGSVPENLRELLKKHRNSVLSEHAETLRSFDLAWRSHDAKLEELLLESLKKFVGEKEQEAYSRTTGLGGLSKAETQGESGRVEVAKTGGEVSKPDEPEV